MENGTGVYYQAMPAVGPDGKNVMKLIPVQKVNGQFFHTHILGTKNDTQSKVYSQLAHISLETSPQNRLPMLQAIGDGRFILKTPAEGNCLVNSGESHPQGANDLPKNPIKKVQLTQVTPMTQNALQSPLQNKNDNLVAVINSPQLPVTVKSPILPNGHYLQIPPNATVRTLPASALPQSIKKQICNSATIPSNPAKDLPTVVYVSPVNSLKLGSGQQLPYLTKVSEPPQTLTYPATRPGKNKKISSTSNSKPTQGVTTPMKWVVHEGTGFTAPCLIPVTSPSMTSDILKAVKQMEAARIVNTVGEPTATTSQEKVNPGKDNALVMYNGKVYFVAKKDSEITQDVIAGPGSKPPIRTSVQPSCTSNMAQKKVSKTANEIIDLCGDDEESSSCTGSDGLPAPSPTEAQTDDDTNVIFVSYIPPKSESETSHKNTEAVPQTQQNSFGEGVVSPGCDTVNMGKDFKRSSTSITGANLGCQDNAPVLENVEASVSAQPQDICDQGTDVTGRDSAVLCRLDTEAVTEVSLEKAALDQICRQKSDSELRRIFGITSDLRICLQRINQSKEPDQQVERRSIKRTLEGIRRFINQSQIETKIKRLIQAQVSIPKLEESGPKKSKRQKLDQDRWTCTDTPSFVTTNSSSGSKDPVKRTEEMQPVPPIPCTDREVLQTCRNEETLSCTVACKVSHQTTEPICPSSSLQPAPTPSATSYTNGGARPPVLRKISLRVSKGSGRVCTACPCGTKVGAVRTNPLSKPEENPVLPAVVDSSRGAVAVTESNKRCHRDEKVVENSSSSSPDNNGVSDGAEAEVVRHTPTHDDVLFDGTCSSQNSSHHPEGANQLDPPSKETTCSSSSSTSGDITLGESFEQGPVGQPETAPQEPYTLIKAEGKVSSSSAAQANSVGDSFPYELFSSLLLDPEEIKRQERIRHLKDLLREKEAALKKLRQSM